MIVLGVLLLVIAILFTLGTVFGNGQEAMADVFGVSLSGVSVGGLFLGGVVVGALGMLGLSLLLGGGARKRHKAVERKREVNTVKGQASTLEEENARLRGQLADRPTARTDQPRDTR